MPRVHQQRSISSHSVKRAGAVNCTIRISLRSAVRPDRRIHAVNCTWHDAGQSTCTVNCTSGKNFQAHLDEFRLEPPERARVGV